jgi:polysaccharide deacetylase 2 family uncharacterized protein YibQ
VDDFGNNLDIARALCALGRPVTAAILPYAPQTRETALLAAGCGVEIMLHLPLEALVPKENSAGRIGSGMTAEEVRARVSACLDQVPGLRGVNNHEGSRTTVDAVLMPEILTVLKERNLYFIDSLTTKDSIAFDTARRMGVPAAVRRVFLDGDQREGSGEAGSLRAAREIRPGRRISHARGETLEALDRYLGLAADYGVNPPPPASSMKHSGLLRSREPLEAQPVFDREDEVFSAISAMFWVFNPAGRSADPLRPRNTAARSRRPCAEKGSRLTMLTTSISQFIE